MRSYRRRVNRRKVLLLKRRAAPILVRRQLLRSLPGPPRRLPVVLKLFFILSLLFLLFLGAGTVAVSNVYSYYARELSGQMDRLKTRHVFETSRIYDRNGFLLYELFGEGKRTKLESLDQVPQELIWATLAAEDKTFYENSGVDVAGIVRAALLIAQSGEIQGGGSTLTQQLIRNALFTQQERYSPTLDRKIREAMLAVEMTRTYSKDEILLMYLNEIPYGNLSYGIEAAAQSYFGRHASELNLAQCAFLAGLPQSPTEYNPFFQGGMEKAKARQWDVLRLMVENGYITQQQADASYDEPTRFASQETPIYAPHFVMWVRQQLENDPDIGPEKLYNGGLTIYTSLDYRYQRLAENLIRLRLSQPDAIAYNANNGAFLAMKPATGEVLAMVGSVDYNLVKPSRCGFEGNVVDGQVNVTLSHRQPGSAFKPVVYLAAFTKGWTPATIVVDASTNFAAPGAPPYVPKNYSGGFMGAITVRTALACSLNIPAIKALQFAGIEYTVDLAHRMGVTGLQDPNEYYLPLAIGGGAVSVLDLATAYSTIDNLGRYVPPVAILKIVDSDGHVIKEYKPAPLEMRPQVVEARYAYMVVSIISDRNARIPAFGANNVLEVSRPAAAKTGTAEDWSDDWTMGFTPYLVAGGWIGNNNYETLTLGCIQRGGGGSGIPGASAIGVVWHQFMEALFNQGDPKVGLPAYFPDAAERQQIFGDRDIEDVLRDENGNLQIDFVPPEGYSEPTPLPLPTRAPTPKP